MVKPLSYVTVHDDDGEAHTFSPDDELPEWAVGKIHNPNVLPEQEQDQESQEPPAGQEPSAPPQEQQPPAGQTVPPADSAPTKGNAGK